MIVVSIGQIHDSCRYVVNCPIDKISARTERHFRHDMSKIIGLKYLKLRIAQNISVSRNTN